MLTSIVYWTVIRPGLGFRMHLAGNDAGLMRASSIESTVEFIENPGWIQDDRHPLLLDAASQLRAYFAGRLREFDLPLILEGTAFEKQVWEAVRAIPFGERRSYGAVAAMVGRPKAARAVGTANRNCPIGVIVPCHRVVAAGGLGGFGGREDVKQRLLDFEANQLK